MGEDKLNIKDPAEGLDKRRRDGAAALSQADLEVFGPPVRRPLVMQKEAIAVGELGCPVQNLDLRVVLAGSLGILEEEDRVALVTEGLYERAG